MALTRKSLKAMGLTDEQVDSIVEMHTDTVDALREQRDQYKADAEKLPGVQKELDTAKADAETSKKDSWKVKYDALKEDFDTYKNDISSKETAAAKQTAYKALLAECKISNKRHDAILKIADLDSIELDDKGKIKGADKLAETLKTEWADFVVTETTKSEPPATPPTTGDTDPDYDKMSDAEYYAAMAAKKKD